MHINKLLQQKRFFQIALVLVVILAGLICNNNLRHQNPEGHYFQNDVDQYYSILPSAFYQKDVAYKYDNHTFWNQYYPNKYNNRYWTRECQDGKRMTMATLGVPYSYLPFFTAAYLVNEVLGNNELKPPGYDNTFVVASVIHMFLLAICLCLLLFEVAIRYTSHKTSALATLILFFGTNILFYFFSEGLMPHAILAVLATLFILSCLRWLIDGNIKYGVAAIFSLAWLGLIRPVDGLIILFPITILLTNKAAREHLLMFLKKPKYIVLSLVVVAVLFAPQLMYWKYITGDYIVYSYKGESFHFTAWNLIKFWFSFRKGWFVYSPICLILFVIAFVKAGKQKLMLAATIAVLAASLLYAQWWSWWYGGSFGMRTMVQFTPLLMLPLAYLLAKSSGKKKYIVYPVLSFFVLLNIYQSRQFHWGQIHYDSMTKDAYWSIFMGKQKPFDYYGLLKKPDYRGARREGREYVNEKIVKIANTTNSKTAVAEVFEPLNNKQGYLIAKLYHKSNLNNVILGLKILDPNGNVESYQERFLDHSSFNSDGEGFTLLDYDFEKVDRENYTANAFVYNPNNEIVEVDLLELTIY